MTNSNIKISGFNNETVGTQTITLTYKEKITTFTIEIKSESQGIDKSPTSSNFDDVTGDITEAQYNFFTQNTADSYAKVKMKISNIKIGDEDSTYTYYYYLSGKQGETDIPSNNWKKVTAQKENDGTYSITIDINTNDIENIYKICESENVFVYLKEVAQLSNQSVEVVKTIKVGNKAEARFYLDREKVEGIDAILDVIKQNNQGSNPNSSNTPNVTVNQQQGKKDDTTASKVLPQTGILSIVIIAILGFAVIGGYSYYRYKNIDR